MIEVEKRVAGLRIKNVWLSEAPFDQEGLDSISFISCRGKVDLPGFDREDRSTIVVDLRKGIDQVWTGINSKCRSDIKKAEKDNFRISIDDRYEDFIGLNRSFRDLKGLDEHEFSLDFMKRYCTLFTAERDGQLLGGILFLKDDSCLLGLISATRRLDADRDLRADIARMNRLLWWEAIKHGSEGGLATLDMGGYYTGTEPDPQKEGVNEFKRRFGGTVIGDYIYRKDYTLKMKLVRKTSHLVSVF